MIMRKKAGQIIGGLPLILAYGQLGTASGCITSIRFSTSMGGYV
jgi:hypothetical protein